MKYSLLENGIDSLKASFDSINNIYNQHNPAYQGYHHIKDSILSINHANEILFKYLLFSINEHLIYRDINKYIAAKRQMVEQKLNHILDAKKLDTINIHEAIERLIYVCNLDVPSTFRGLIGELNAYRNKIMHYEIELSEDEVYKLIHKLQACYDATIIYFDEKFGNIEEQMRHQRFDYTLNDYLSDYYDQLADGMFMYKAEAMDLAGQNRGGFNSKD